MKKRRMPVYALYTPDGEHFISEGTAKELALFVGCTEYNISRMAKKKQNRQFYCFKFCYTDDPM